MQKSEKLLQANGFINYKLTGEMTIDLDCASRCQCLDINSLTWSDEIAKVLDVDFNALLPQPSKITDIIGTVTEKAAAETGLVSGIPVVAGCSDAMASMYATGLSQLGEAGESSGTTSLVFVGSPVQSRSDVPVVTKPCAIDGMPYIFDGPINASGASIKWYLDTFGQADKEEAEELGINVYEYLNREALEVAPGSDGLLFFPYMLGERAPLWNSYSRGMFIGMSLNTERKHFVRSVFEGTAFALRHVMETIQRSRRTGGMLTHHRRRFQKPLPGHRSNASMLHMPIYILDEPTAGLHSKDTPGLVAILKKLRDLGNTVLVIEHDTDIMESADHIIDMGPGAGRFGGEIIASGTLRELMRNPASVTGLYLKNPDSGKSVFREPTAMIRIEHANAFNLKDLAVDIPVGCLTSVTGPSGSGKSTLLFEVLSTGGSSKNGRVAGFERFDKIVRIEQAAIPRMKRSNVATYADVYTDIRSVFGKTGTAKRMAFVRGIFPLTLQEADAKTAKGWDTSTTTCYSLPIPKSSALSAMEASSALKFWKSPIKGLPSKTF